MFLKSSHTRVLTGLFFGLFLGLAAHSWQENPVIQFVFQSLFAFMGQIFLHLIFMMIVPLIFSAMTLSSYKLYLQHNAGFIAKKAALGAFIFAILAAAIAFIVTPIATLQSLDENSLNQIYSLSQTTALQTSSTTTTTLSHWLAKNPVSAMAKALEGGSIIPVMIFAWIIGFSLAKTNHTKKDLLIDLLEVVQQICFTWIQWVMKHIAPWAVSALVAASFYSLGFKLLSILSSYIAAVVIGLCLQEFVVYGLTLKYGAKVSPLWFFKQIQEALMTAFSTSSSSATLPVSLNIAQEKLKLPSDSSRLVLSLGSSTNQNGSALFEGITVLFLTHLFGVELTASKQFMILVMCITASLGTAGVPGSTIPVMASILESLGVPSCSLLLILGVDRFLDMMRTTVNVTGDLVLAQWVASGEKLQNDEA